MNNTYTVYYMQYKLCNTGLPSAPLSESSGSVDYWKGSPFRPRFVQPAAAMS